MIEETSAASARAAAASLPSLAELGDLLPSALAVLGADDAIRYANARFVDLLGLAGERPPLPALLARLDGASGIEPESIARQLRSGGEHVFERGERTLALRGQPLAGGALLLVVEDLGSHGAAAAYAEKLAHHDPLTGLGNRASVRVHLEAALRRAGPLAVFCLDLDHFKLVNDTLGHVVGDKLLQRAAERLRSVIGTHGDIARLGGDEFAIVLPGTDREDAARLATRIVDLVGRAYLVDEHLINITVSVGITLSPDDGVTPGDLLKHADLALYHAKARGRACFCFFQPEMNARLLARRALEFELRKALGLRQFELHYQPQLNLERGRVESVEALLRWNHPDGGRVSPADFIPLAEELGLIVPIGEWVIRTACKDAAAWPDHIKVAVNLSPVQFTSARLFGVVKSALDASRLAPERLELEITESALLNDSPATLKTLHQIRALGVRISMDDFGTGYSSLSYLRSFPFDKIKIDQSFVRGIESSNDCIAIVRAIAGLASTLGMSTTAEGVETAAQLDRVRAEGCTDIQGYLISKPLPLAELEQLIEAPHAFRAA